MFNQKLVCGNSKWEFKVIFIYEKKVDCDIWCFLRELLAYYLFAVNYCLTWHLHIKVQMMKKCDISTTLQICAVELQWKCIKKTVISKNYSSLQLTLDCCIFYNLKIVILELFSCSLFCIELNANITSFHCF